MSSQNPIGSSTMADLLFNAGNLDRALHSQDDYWIDRFNIQRMTYGKMERVAKMQQSFKLSREALKRSYAEAGLNLVDGSFEAGGTVTGPADVLLQENTGLVFGLVGNDYPKAVSKNSVPNSDWVSKTLTLRENLFSDDGGSKLISFMRDGWIKHSLNNKVGKLYHASDFIKNDGTDQSALLNAAMLLISNLGGGTLIFDAGHTFKMAGVIVGQPNVNLLGESNSWLDFTLMANYNTTREVGLITYRGTTGDFIYPTSDLVAGNNKINVPNANDFKIGDLIELSINDRGKWFDTSVQVTAGQLAIVTNVFPTTNNILLSTPIFETLEVSKSARIRKINPIKDITINNVGIIGKGRNPDGNADQGLKVIFGQNVKLTNNRIKFVDTGSLEVVSCYNVEISGNNIEHNPLGDINIISYAIVYSSSQFVNIFNNHTINCRHGIISSHLSRNTAIYGVSRFIDIHNNFIETNYGDTNTTGYVRAHAGIATHTDAEYVFVHDNVISGCRYGVNLRTWNSVAKNNKLHFCKIGVYLSEYWSDLEITGNHFYDCLQLIASASAGINEYNFNRGLIIVDGNKGWRSGSVVFNFPAAGGTIEITGTVFKSYLPSSELSSAISIYGTAESIVSDNKLWEKYPLLRIEHIGLAIVVSNKIIAKEGTGYPATPAAINITSVVTTYICSDNIIVGPEGFTVAAPNTSIKPGSINTGNKILRRG
ncbi:right-handed parallel beta-helix repeat-containing protein [Aeromonas phage ZPAH34]|uniref:tail spike protein n=1 Tax=Aeromonas phage ZPAH34 TaxID=2924888 RepID=UPI002329957A|nr:tail spike protein [Aeromonas phage ZPAH34]UOX39549.1 right-handed parallel beta-helix repeat-containing protein [Aeromonas phage ZPAH34]